MKRVHPALTVVASVALGLSAPLSTVAGKNLPVAGEVFELEGKTAFLILPPKEKTDTADPTPWIWYAPTLPRLPGKEETWMIEKFLAKGIAIAGIDVGESYGSPAGRKSYSALYKELVGNRGMAKKASLLARSRGGLMLYSWAAENPESVACIAGIYPVCNLASYPGVAKASGAYGLTSEEMTAQLATHNPIDRLTPLAKAKVPIFHIHGDKDTVVPLEKNSAIVAERYEKAGGKMILKVIKGQGHNMWRGWFESEELVGFVIKHARPTTPKPGATISKAEAAIAALGGHVFRDARSGQVTEVKLNGISTLTDADLSHLAGFTNVTDLSLEDTAVTGAGLAHLSKLEKLEWLNLWQTRVDDVGLAHLENLRALQALPVGGTKITDAGLVHLWGLRELEYVGLRDTAVTDTGVGHLAALPSLKELNLRGTKVTDACIATLRGIVTLRKVWLGATAVTKDGVARLRTARPDCTIDLEE